MAHKMLQAKCSHLTGLELAPAHPLPCISQSVSHIPADALFLGAHMSIRPVVISSDADLRAVAKLRFLYDIERLPVTQLPQVSLHERERREFHRRDLHDPFIAPFSYIDDGRGQQFKALADAELEPCLHRVDLSLKTLAFTQAENRRDQSCTKLVKLTTELHGTNLLRATLPAEFTTATSPAIQLLRQWGFRQQPWKQLTRLYTPNDFSLLGQYFWETSRLPFEFGEAGELLVTRAEMSQVEAHSRLRLGLATGLGYAAHYEHVEASTAKLIEPPSGVEHRSTLLSVMEGSHLIASVRITPKYCVWEGLPKLEIRDIVIAGWRHKRGLLPWVFNAAVMAGRTFIHPDEVFNQVSRIPETLLVETWLPNERLVQHFQAEIPRLQQTGLQYFENF